MENKKLLYTRLRVTEGSGDEALKIAYEKQKQTYELIILSTTDEKIKSIAERKLRELTDLAASCNFNDIVLETDVVNEYEDIIAACYRLLENKHKGEKEINDMLNMLNRTEITAENYYLQTVLLLEMDNGHHGCERAIGTIRSALNIEPNNYAYKALETKIVDVLEAKKNFEQKANDRLNEYIQEQERIRKEQVRAARWQQAWSICCGIGECLGTCALGSIQCFCECMDGCC